MKKLAESIGTRLRSMRERKGWSWRECQEAYNNYGIKCSRQLVGDWESKNPPLDRITDLAKFWDVPEHWLLTGLSLKGDFEDKLYRQFLMLTEDDKSIIKGMIDRMTNEVGKDDDDRDRNGS